MTPEGTDTGAKAETAGAPRISLWGMVEASGALGVALSLAGFAGEAHWLLELTTHFRAQYLVFLLVMAGLLAVGRRRRFATVCLVCAALNAAVLAPWIVPASSVKPAGASLRLMALNVHTANTRHDLVLGEIRRVQPDVLLLMEVNHAWVLALQDLSKTLPHRVIIPREDNFGIALFSRLPLTSSEVINWPDDFGVPSILAVIEPSGQPVFVVATHPLPPASKENAALRNEQLEKIAGAVSGQTLPAVVLGDLNATPWSPHFRNLERAASLRDTGRRSGWHPTWPSELPLLWIPLDHCLVSKEIPYATRTVGNYVGSDHFPIIVDVVLPPHQRP
ncbi:MAG: endonuclease/exonuclease/phosphatase family protein [Chthoniobacteraceae bacterium]